MLVSFINRNGIRTNIYIPGSIAYFVPAVNFLVSTICQPLYGRFSDIFGRKAMICFCITVFIVGNIASGFSRSITELIIFRGMSFWQNMNSMLIYFQGLTGLGDGGVMSIAQIIISDLVSLRDRYFDLLIRLSFFLNTFRGKYIGYIGVFIVIGQGLGPFIGGELAERVTWRVCISFASMIPLANSQTGVIVVFLDHTTNRRSWNRSCFVPPPVEECRGWHEKVSVIANTTWQ